MAALLGGRQTPHRTLRKPDHAIGKGRNSGPEAENGEVARYPLASTLFSDAQARALVAQYGPEAHPEESLSLACEDIANLIEGVVASDAVYLGVLAAAREKIEAGLLVELPVRPEFEPSQFAIIRLAGRSAPPAFRMVRELIRERMRD